MLVCVRFLEAWHMSTLNFASKISFLELALKSKEKICLQTYEKHEGMLLSLLSLSLLLLLLLLLFPDLVLSSCLLNVLIIYRNIFSASFQNLHESDSFPWPTYPESNPSSILTTNIWHPHEISPKPKLSIQISTQWVDVDDQEFASLTSWLLSGNCRVAVRPQIYRRESRDLYELIFVAFDWLRILMHDHLLVLTHITLTLHTR